MSQQDVTYDARTPVQCRNGPISDRKCTDWLCFIFYLILIAGVVFLGAYSSKATKMSSEEVEKQLQNSQFGQPLLAIVKAAKQIILSLMCVVSLSLVLVLTTFLIPSLVAFIYIPFFLILMLLIGSVFLFRYFGQNIPFLNPQIQQHYAHDHSILALGVAIGFLGGFFISIIVICCKKQKFKNMVPVLQIAKKHFWQNCYIFLISIALSMISILALYFNVYLLQLSQDKKNSQHYIDVRITGAIIVLEMLWTHGFIQALSDFTFESIAIHWYFNNKKRQDGYSRCIHNFSSTIALVGKHIGTITFGHILSFIPQTFNTLLSRCEQTSPTCYDVCCVFHRCTCRNLSKYSYCQTILQSHSFCEANRSMHELTRRTKRTLPELYMMGNFYMTLAKVFIIMFSLTICFILTIQNQNQLFNKAQNLIGPLIVALLGSLQIAGHFMNLTGLIGDTITFMYTVDTQIEKNNYNDMQPYSCPKDVRQIIINTKIGQGIYDE